MNLPEQFRWRNAPPPYATQPGDPGGAFLIPGRAANGRLLKVICDCGLNTGWEHVSVSIGDQPKATPSWLEMCAVKRLFWPADECVIQYHPPESDYVNFHPGVLHLWRPVDGKFPMPPKTCV